MRMKCFRLAVVLAAALALVPASAVGAAGPPDARPGAVVTRACVDGNFTITVRLPPASASGGAQLRVDEAKKPC
jgi:hypothetical protein